LALLTLSASAAIHAQDITSGPWVMQSSWTDASFRGIHTVGGGIVWASGTNGTVLRTEDSGYMWQSCSMPPGAEKLDFRGIWAWDEDDAIVMSSGPGDQSRLYRTTDGCSHWKLVFTNPDKDGFWDAIVFWKNIKGNITALGQEAGILLGDPVQGHFTRFEIENRGDEFFRSKDLESTPALNGEGAFAASNSSVALGKRFQQGIHPIAWFGTGGKSGPRIYRLEGTFAEVSNYRPELLNHHWTAVSVPLASGNASSGVFSLAFRDDQHGMAVGGDYQKPNDSTGTAAWTADGGQHWTAAAKPPHGYRSTVAWDENVKAWIAAGPNGSDISYDDGKTWASLDNGNWNAISLPWIVGPKGRIAKLDEGKLKH
jgi:photosystem II stability/assembly factor-like uncharacterized protein